MEPQLIMQEILAKPDDSAAPEVGSPDLK